jgi:hypothetical protein
LGAAVTLAPALQPVRQGLPFAATLLGRDLIDRVVQIAQRLLPRSLVFRMESQ